MLISERRFRPIVVLLRWERSTLVSVSPFLVISVKAQGSHKKHGRHRVYSSDCVDPGTVGKVTNSAIEHAVAILPGGIYELK